MARGPTNFFSRCFGMLASEDMVPAASGAPKLGLGCAGRSPMVGLEYPVASPPLAAATSEFDFPGEGIAAFRLAGILGYCVGERPLPGRRDRGDSTTGERLPSCSNGGGDLKSVSSEEVEIVVTPLSVDIIRGRVNDRVEDRRWVDERRGKLPLLPMPKKRGRGAYGCCCCSCSWISSSEESDGSTALMVFSGAMVMPRALCLDCSAALDASPALFSLRWLAAFTSARAPAAPVANPRPATNLGAADLGAAVNGLIEASSSAISIARAGSPSLQLPLLSAT